MKNAIVTFCMLWCIAGWATEKSGCTREKAGIYLDVLHVHTCLIKSNENSETPPVVTHIRQTFKNIGTKEIELQLSSDPIRRTGIAIFREGVQVSRPSEAPRLHDPTYIPPKNEYVYLAPGQEYQASQRIEELASIPIESGKLYSIFARVNHGFRYLNEKQGYAFSLRQDEANAKKQYPKSLFFEDVRLK